MGILVIVCFVCFSFGIWSMVRGAREIAREEMFSQTWRERLAAWTYLTAGILCMSASSYYLARVLSDLFKN